MPADRLKTVEQYIKLPKEKKKNFKKVLLINPSWRKATYLETNVKAATLSHPVLALPTLATPILQAGHDARILDLDLYTDPDSALKEALEDYKPDIVGTTGTTPFFHEVIRISKIIKEYNKDIRLVVGGAHATAFPEEFVETNLVDYAIYGEGDFVLVELIEVLEGKRKINSVLGICYNNGGIVKTDTRPLLKNFDYVPMPSWHLVDIDRYANSHVLSRANPVGPIETSRGCPWSCHYCTKTIFGVKFNAKSPKRVVDEMEFMLKMGFREVHVQDDLFSTDLNRAKEICREILRRKLKFPWMLINGIRVDRVDLELLKKLKKAGCYMTAFGIESGNQGVLDDVGKGITLEQTRRAAKLAKKAGMETFGFFMLGLPKDTEETMQQTIDFAKELDLDVVKFDITVPLPGTTLYKKWEQQGLIKTRDWKDYLFHQDASVLYEHPNLDWETIRKYYRKAFREYYFRPAYIAKRFKKSLLSRNLLKDFKSLIQTKWS